MIKILKIFVFFITFNGFSQSLHHQMLSAQGGNSIASSGVIVKYTIGQQTVTGSTTENYIVQQGFQQNNWDKIIKKIMFQLVLLLFPIHL